MMAQVSEVYMRHPTSIIKAVQISFVGYVNLELKSFHENISLIERWTKDKNILGGWVNAEIGRLWILLLFCNID